MENDAMQLVAQSLDRIAKILSGILLRDIEDADQRMRIKRLKRCGFENVEIARMLGTTPNSVNVAVHSLKHEKGKSRQRK